MSIPVNDQDPRQSALKDGIVIGVLACLREFGLEANQTTVESVLKSQQGWSESDINYYLKFFGLN